MTKLDREKFLSPCIAKKMLLILKEKNPPIYWGYKEFSDPREAIEEILAIVSAYLDAVDEIESLRNKKEKSKRISEKDTGWFPGDCCD